MTVSSTDALLQLDTADVQQFDTFAEEVQLTLQRIWNRNTIDFLINNAGFDINQPFAETTWQDFDRLMNVHLKGVFLVQRLLPLMADGGRIVNLSTGLTRFTLPGYATYGSVKGGVEVLRRYLARELGPRGIAVNTVAPGGH